ncbi:MAG TPA: trehalose-phosphatase, partial [Gaiellaceae bacterium]
MEDANRLLEPLSADPGRAAILLDVDGTLAPIVARPELADVPEPARAELRRLVARYALVACISGRTGADAHRLVGVDGIVYVGVHGLELAPEADAWRAPLREFAAVDWPWIEDKGLTVAYHWREA